jgi:hypothetical protein
MTLRQYLVCRECRKVAQHWPNPWYSHISVQYLRNEECLVRWIGYNKIKEDRDVHALGQREGSGVVSHRLLTAEDRVRVQGNPRRICGGQSRTGTDFFPSSSVSPVSIISPVLRIHSCVSWGLDNGPASGRSSIET